MANCKDCIHFGSYFGLTDLCTYHVLMLGEDRAQDCKTFEEKIENEETESKEN